MIGRKGEPYIPPEQKIEEDEEARLLSIDPKKTSWIDINEITEEDHFSSFIAETFGQDSRTRRDFEDELPFEEQDIAKTWQTAGGDERQKLKTYSLPEFRLMEEAFRFKMLADQDPQLNKSRPAFADGRPLADEQIREQAQEYALCKKAQRWSDYSKFELDLMKRCSFWWYLFNQVSKRRQKPTLAGGKSLADEQLTELSEEYRNFRKENPTEFAELKVENGEWQEGDFKWRATEYKGKKQWSCVQSRVEGDGKNKKKITTKYVVANPPAKVIPEQAGRSFFHVRNQYTVNDTLKIVFLELHPPFSD